MFGGGGDPVRRRALAIARVQAVQKQGVLLGDEQVVRARLW